MLLYAVGIGAKKDDLKFLYGANSFTFLHDLELIDWVTELGMKLHLFCVSRG